jgi:hypothetical protein
VLQTARSIAIHGKGDYRLYKSYYYFKMCSTIKSSYYHGILIVVTALLPFLVSTYSDKDFLNAPEANITNMLQSKYEININSTCFYPNSHNIH